MGSVLCYEKHVLYPYAELSGQINTRFHGHNIAGLKKYVFLRPRREIRQFVNLDADAVTGAVTELFTVACGLDYVTADLVGVKRPKALF